MNRIIAVFLILLVAASRLPVRSQVSELGKEIGSGYERGKELFYKEKYAPAIIELDRYLSDPLHSDPGRVADAKYMGAISALKLFNPDGEFRMTRFINDFPGSPRVNTGYLALADYYYQNKNFRKAGTYYEKVNRLELEQSLLPAYYFRNGYSQFMKGDKNKALVMFAEIKDIDTDYSSPANYYFSQIAYDEKNYETALEGFMRLKDDETFGSVVPFYIAQILYIKKDYDGILELAPGLLKSAGPQRAVELYRFIGDAYYNKGQYPEALGYLEKYSAGAKASGREDKYQLAYCYYKTGQNEKAIKIFLDLTATPDVMSQNIWCLLGDSYLKSGDKTRARFAFGQASLMDHDKKLKEESLFNYAKLTFEISGSPFGEAINAFQEYIDQFPGSDKIQEAYNYLVATYLQLKNYKAALASLEKINTRDSRLEEAYQRIAFFRGLELVKNNELGQAVDMFDKSLKFEKYNRILRARAIYWRGEASYRLGQFEKALADYQTFIGIPGASSLQEYNDVRYNMGYACFSLKDYNKALVHFKAFESNVTAVRPEVMADTRNRIADCYFIGTDYENAVTYYNKVIDYGKVDADYAMYQKGFAQGLSNNNKGKVDVLSSLITKYPASKYLPAAWFERGRAFVSLKELKRGEADFNQLITSYPNSPYVPRAIVQLGLLYFDNGENPKAIAQFKKVIENYKSSPEARYALTGLKNAYIDSNDVESYFAYVKTLEGYGDVKLSEKDSLLFSSGERLYMTGNCDKASESLKGYLKEFQNGSFRVNALFYLAECAARKGKTDEALAYYTELTEAPGNEFMEEALKSVAEIYYGKEDFLKSYGYYERLEKVAESKETTLESLKGQLRSAYQAGDAPKTLSVAARISGGTGMPDDLSREAFFMSGKAYYSLDQNEEALSAFRKVSGEVTTIEGAESKYRVGELLFKKGLTADAEKVVNEFLDLNTPHQYWMARVFILLADISIRKGDKLQASATLKGLKDSYPVDSDGIIDEVKSKLDALNPPSVSNPDSSAVKGPAVK
ncbi:MAG: tetratricopeptide repeat protein [Bacteroidales bacterium]